MRPIMSGDVVETLDGEHKGVVSLHTITRDSGRSWEMLATIQEDGQQYTCPVGDVRLVEEESEDV